MNNQLFLQLEDLLFKIFSGSPNKATSIVSSILGVLIGLKPGAMVMIEVSLLDNNRLDTFLSILYRLGLSTETSRRTNITPDDDSVYIVFYISRDEAVAKNLESFFAALWEITDNNSMVSRREEWENLNLKIGTLLGYPETAIKYFISNDMSEDWRERIARNRYYAHSKEHEEEEYYAYDQKLNRAVNEFAPKTAKIYCNNKTKRWLSYQLGD